MSPEYAWTGMFSEKSDIYAFGVLLLEIITGKRISSFTIGEEGKSLLEYVSQTTFSMLLDITLLALNVSRVLYASVCSSNC